ncbi:hypothetical protein PCIT_b0025 [Pseudoalteromonas citrea]|uniref:Lcl C-terminal domain-containing protein n=2 Tax=Pseudoalteromonas citrea TaxID=43655 RepID=A0AAD4FPK3_9GAMM|nr:DUF1566 domain-containing protein [Pseudoalteromonas citrea]KAF7764118.1 hypothetical protein PCIT_b0025 [Pseudoalteromonas citrea]
MKISTAAIYTKEYRKKSIYLCFIITLTGCNYSPDDSQDNESPSDTVDDPIMVTLPTVPLCNGPCSCDDIILKGNDTGIRYSADYPTENLSLCNLQAPFMQDCQIGRDQQALAGTLEKVGFGNAGFDYSKISNNGELLPNDAQTWQCIQDNHTGLIWEVKAPQSSGLANAADQTYSYANPRFLDYSSENLGVCSVEGACDTHKYLTLINKQALCGFTDWRLPSKIELQDLVDYSAVQPAIDLTAFPNTKVGNYWTDTIDTDDTNSIWAVNFNFGTAAGGVSANKQMIRLVRGNAFVSQLPAENDLEINSQLRNEVAPKQRCNRIVDATAPIGRFKRDNTGSVLDTFTGLIWQACVAGKNGENCIEGEANLYTWQEALEHAQEISEQTQMPWRLPNLKELQRTIENQCEEPALNPFAFPNVPMTQVWSATPHSKETDKSYHYQYQNSIIFYGTRTEKHAVHLVRDCYFQ